MSSSESTALVVVTPDKEAEKLPDAETIAIPAAIMLAAETVADSKGAHAYHTGVYLHARDRRGRVVSTDGHRMFIASFALPHGSKMPSWMSQGLLIASEGLKARLSMIAKGEQRVIKVTHVKGTHRAQLSDVEGDIVFNLETVSVTYPDYEKVIGTDSFVDLDEDGKPRGLEWKPIGIGSVYLKQCGDIAKLLNNGIPKGEREKSDGGMVVRAFTGDSSRPVVFDFPDYPGAVLAVMPLKVSSGSLSRETAALLAPAVKGSIAALRAHSTRWLQVANAATNDADREAAIAKSQEFKQRIAKLMASAPVTQIGRGKDQQPEPDPAEQHERDTFVPPPEPQPEAEPEEQQPEEQPVGGPKVTRRKVKVQKAAE
jgi:hypothetical protein